MRRLSPVLSRLPGFCFCWLLIGLFPCVLYMVVCFFPVLAIFILSLPTYIVWPHIVIVSFATLLPVVCLFLTYWKIGQQIDEVIERDEAKQSKMTSLWRHFSSSVRLCLMLLQLIAVMGLLGWSLYRTGSYSTIHDLFWNSWSLPPWNVQTFKMHIFDWFHDLAIIRILTFSLPMTDILGASVGIQLFTLIGCVLPRRIINCIIAFKSKSQEVTTRETTRETDESPVSQV